MSVKKSIDYSELDDDELLRRVLIETKDLTRTVGIPFELLGELSQREDLKSNEGLQNLLETIASAKQAIHDAGKNCAESS